MLYQILVGSHFVVLLIGCGDGVESFSVQSILARSMADKSIDDIEPLVSATKKMCEPS
ncbi:hypothetical protein [Bacteroides xylanisolvens]|uniref:hypothetical protein n=1 Tax=Bacteroides xylanisolvens TaxID=371601 RepID=UPI001AD80C7D|nr:hypothetical protein [Bacteroides xylanisolvens]